LTSKIVKVLVWLAASLLVIFGFLYVTGLISWQSPENPFDFHFVGTVWYYSNLLSEANITVLQSTKPFSATVELSMDNFTEWTDYAKATNVAYVITDYAPVVEPNYLAPNTMYFLEEYNFWFYESLPNVGQVAIVCPVQLEAYYGGK
jgi:hypothetical protein